MAKGNELDDIKKEILKEKSKPLAEPAGSGPGSDDTGENPGAPEKGSNDSGGLLGSKLGEMAERMTLAAGKASGTGPDSGMDAKSADKKSGSSPSPQHDPDKMKKEINDMVKKKIDSRFSGIQNDLKGLEKISSLEGKINQITEKINSQMFQPVQQAGPVKGGGGSISRELASFGEEVDFQTELYDTKKTIASIAKSLDTLSKKMEYRISILEDRAKILDRIPDLEERFQDIRQKLGPENVQKLRKLIFSSDEIIDEVIPDLVNKKLRNKLDPAMNEIRDMQDTINDFNSRLSHIKEEVLNLEKLRDDIQELRADKENLYKELEEDSSRENERLDVLKQNVRRKIENVVDKFAQEIKDIKKNQTDSIKGEVSNSFLEIIEPRFAELEKKQDIFSDRIKRMSNMDTELEKKISSIEAPENIKKWLEARIDKIERGLVSDINSLEKKTLQNNAGIAAVADDLKTFNTSMKDVPKRLGNQGNMINKLLDTKDFFVGKAETLSSEVKNLSEKTSDLHSRYSALEERISGQDSRFADNLNRQRDYLVAAKEELSKHLNKELGLIRNSLAKSAQEQSRTTLAEFKAEIKRLSSTEEELKALRKSQDTSLSRLQGQLSGLQQEIKEANPAIRLLGTRINDIESVYKNLSQNLAEASEFHKASDSVLRTELTKYIDSNIKSLAKELEARRSDDAKAQTKRLSSTEVGLEALRKSQDASVSRFHDQISGLKSGLEATTPGIRILVDRISALEDTQKSMVNDITAAHDRLKSSDSVLRTELTKYIDSNIKSLAKELEARRSDDAKAQIREFKDEVKRLESLNQELSSFRKSQETRTDELSEAVAGLSGPITDLKVLSRKVSELEDILLALDKRMDVEKDKSYGGMNSLENRLNLIEKTIGDLGRYQNVLEKRISQDNENLRKTLGKMVSDKKALEKGFVDQRAKMADLIREMKNL